MENLKYVELIFVYIEFKICIYTSIMQNAVNLNQIHTDSVSNMRWQFVPQ